MKTYRVVFYVYADKSGKTTEAERSVPAARFEVDKCGNLLFFSDGSGRPPTAAFSHASWSRVEEVK